MNVRMAVIIPAFNAATFVGDALDSVLAQTRSPDELLIADDGSTDRTADIICSHPALRGSGRRFIRHPNRGRAATRNGLVALAESEWVVLLDADDVMQPNRLERIERQIVADDAADLIVSNGEVFYQDGRVSHPFYPNTKTWPSPVAMRESVIKDNFVFPHCAVRRDRWLQVGGMLEDLAQAEDYSLWLKLILSGSVPKLIDEPLVRYRVHDTNVSHNTRGMPLGQRRALRYELDKGRLAPNEVRLVRRSIRAQSAWIAWIDATDAVADRRHPGTRVLLAIATAPGSTPRVRMKAFACALRVANWGPVDQPRRPPGAASSP